MIHHYYPNLSPEERTAKIATLLAEVILANLKRDALKEDGTSSLASCVSTPNQEDAPLPSPRSDVPLWRAASTPDGFQREDEENSSAGRVA